MKQRPIPPKGSPRKALRDAILRLRCGRLAPRRLALSVSVGVFIGLLPIPGLQTFVWLGLVALLPIDPIVTYAFTWVSNPLTVLPFTFAELELGSWLFTGRWLKVTLHEFVDVYAATRFGYHLGIGGLILSILCAALAFMISQPLATRLSETRFNNH